MDCAHEMLQAAADAPSGPAKRTSDGWAVATEAVAAQAADKAADCVEQARQLPAALEEIAPLLDKLAAGTHVAVVTLLGSLCPVTLGHIQGFLEARKILLAEPGVRRPARLEAFGEVLGFISLNGDGHVGRKVAAQAQRALDMDQRRHLVSLATEEYPWIQQERNEGRTLSELTSWWSQLNFVHFCMNGADDVVKYRKYSWSSPRNRFITMGRPGYTEAVVEGIRDSQIDVEAGYFILGPQLEDVSSSAVREALVQGNDAALRGLLNERVADWCLANYRT